MNKFKAKPNDLIVVLLGPTGSGKTNFINTLTGNAEKANASQLGSATQGVTPYTVSYRGARLVLIDTPGFDNTLRPDLEILQQIASWLTKKYPDGRTLRLTGVVYLHRITDNRMSSPARKNLQIFGRLCGNVPLRRARLVTTMWDGARGRHLQKLEEREQELMNEFWQPLIEEGARTRRFDNNPGSAMQIVEELVGMEDEKAPLHIQKELVEEGKRLNETDAGKLVDPDYRKRLAEQMESLKEHMNEARRQNDQALAKSLQVQYDQMNAVLQTFEDPKPAKIPLGRRIYLWVFGTESRRDRRG